MRLRETTTGQNTQEAWTSAWAARKEGQRCLLLQKQLTKKWQV